MKQPSKITTLAIVLMLLLPNLAWSAENNPTIIKAVGTWGSLTNYQKHEGPFWNTHIGEASNGAIVGDIKPQTELGLKGNEIMRFIKNGVFDYAYGLLGYVAAESPAIEGGDLSSLTQDIATQRKVTEAHFPIVEKVFAETYNAKLLQLYPFPSQTLWCKGEVGGIADLKGKKIRVYSASLGDFVEGVGGTSVSIPFAEVIPALETGVADCGITGTMSAYKSKWQQVATHAFVLRVGWGMAFGAINMDKWNSMPAKQQALLKKELDALTDAMWDETATEDEIAVACITGGGCDIGKPGNMKLVQPSQEDLRIRDQVARDSVLANWAERCGSECVAEWNTTVGKVLGITIK